MDTTLRSYAAHALAVASLIVVLTSCSGAGTPASSTDAVGSSASEHPSVSSSSSVGSSSSSASPAPTRALTPTAASIRAATERSLASWGWVVVSATQLADTGPRTTELHLVIRKKAGSTGSPWVADGTESTVELLLDPSGGEEALRFVARCTPTSCKARVDNPSCFAGMDCARGGQAIPLAAAAGLEAGSLITWSVAGQSGRAAEAVIGTDPAHPDVPTAVLEDRVGYELISAMWHLPA
jgi:hypothetical protein